MNSFIKIKKSSSNINENLVTQYFPENKDSPQNSHQQIAGMNIYTNNNNMNGIMNNQLISPRNDNIIKMKKLKLVNNLPTNANELKNSPVKIDPFKNSSNFKIESNLQNNPSFSNKLTFENVFNFAKKSSTKNHNIQANSNFNQIGNNLNFPNSNQGQTNPEGPTQISININNFNINNFNLNSHRLKNSKISNANDQIFSLVNSAALNSNDPRLGFSCKLDENEMRTMSPKSNMNYVYNTSSERNLMRICSIVKANDDKKDLREYQENPENNYFSGKMKLLKHVNTLNIAGENQNSKLQRNKIANGFDNIHNSIKKKKIQTIIDGNNDSFINELADLLNNVESQNINATNENDIAKIDIADQNYTNIDTKNEKPVNNINLEIEKCNDYNIPNDIDNNRNRIEEIPDPRINFAQLQMINSNRPQTSYGDISARKKSLQKSLRQNSSKLPSENNDNLFPMPDGLNDYHKKNNNQDFVFKNKLVKLNQK